MLNSREITPESDCCQQPMTHVQRGDQAVCTESSCAPAPASFAARQAARKAAGGGKMAATALPDRSRQASI